MARRTHTLRARAAGTPAGTAPDTERGSVAGAAWRARRRGAVAAARAGADDGQLLGGVPVAVRLQMELVARSSCSAEEALEPVLAVLVGDDGPRCEAIAAAFRTHPGLREQWARTWELLRS